MAVLSKGQRLLDAFDHLNPEIQDMILKFSEEQAAAATPSVVSSGAAPTSQEVDALLGRSFSDKEVAELKFGNLMRLFELRRKLLAEAFSTTEVARLLGISRQAAHERIKSRKLLAVQDCTGWRAPAWQFDPHGPEGVVAGLPAVLRALEMSHFAKLNWLVRPNPYLDGQPPIELLRQGEIQRVLREAASSGYGQN